MSLDHYSNDSPRQGDCEGSVVPLVDWTIDFLSIIRHWVLSCLYSLHVR